MLEALYPLKFHPLLKEKIWGGRKLETMLGRSLPAGQSIGESWEICDRGLDQTVVANGHFAGKSLHELMSSLGQDLMGTQYTTLPPRFPLLFKIIDAQNDLSLQVHPDDAYAQKYENHDSGKTEMWYVLQADPTAKIYCGTTSDINLEKFRHDLNSERIKKHLQVHPAAPGDVFFIPAGVIHAIGRGSLVIEIQENSDLTYRLSDWGRIGNDGKPRPLHIEQGLSVIDTKINTHIQVKKKYQDEVLVKCKYFTTRHVIPKGISLLKIPRDTFQVWTLLSGSGMINGVKVQKGDFVLIPAAIGIVDGTFSDEARLLEIRP